MVDYSKFDKKVDLAALQNDIENAPKQEYENVPRGTYIVSIENMEISETKKGDKLRFTAEFAIKEGKYKGRKMWFHRVICGNTSANWTDAQAIKSIITWLGELGTETEPEFLNYQDFAECVLDIFQEVQNKVELEIYYDADKFDPVKINEVFDL